MKVKVEVTQTTKTIEEVEVEFPLYSYDVYDTEYTVTNVYTRREQDGREIEVRVTDEVGSQITREVRISHRPLTPDSLAYELKQSRCTRQEFDDALAGFLAMVTG